MSTRCGKGGKPCRGGVAKKTLNDGCPRAFNCARTHTRTHAHTHACAHAHAHTHAHTHAHIHTHARTHTHTRTHPHAHPHTPTRTHTCTHTHTHTHARTHTHIHTQGFFLRATHRVLNIKRRFLRVFSRYTKAQRGYPVSRVHEMENFGKYPVPHFSCSWSPREQGLLHSKLAFLPFYYRPTIKHSRTCDLDAKTQKFPMQSPFPSHNKIQNSGAARLT